MKYEEIFTEAETENELMTDIKLVYGKFYQLGDITIEPNEYGLLYVFNTKHDNTYYYGEVNESQLFKDILYYGNAYYEILKDELSIIYSKGEWLKLDCISENAIVSKIKQLEPLIKEFINYYNIPIWETSNNSFHDIDSVALRNIINITLIIYIIHIVHTNLSSGLDKYKKAYGVFGITKEYSNIAIRDALVEFYNDATGAYSNLGIYRTRIIKQNEDGNDLFVPIRYATNLFTFAWDILQNYFCSNVVYKENADEKEYIIYRRCPKCYQTFSSDKTVDISFDKAPSKKILYCTKCSKLARNNRYETDIAKLYKQIKDSLNDIDTTTDEGKKLYNEITHLKAKYHYRNKKILNKLVERIEHNKKR